MLLRLWTKPKGAISVFYDLFMADRSRRISRRRHSSRHDLPAHYCCSRIGRLYLCRDRSRDTVSAARVCRLCHCRLCLSVLSEKEKLRKHGCRPFAAHQRRTLRRSQGMEKKTAKLEFSIAEPSGMPNRKKVHRWFQAFGRSSG